MNTLTRFLTSLTLVLSTAALAQPQFFVDDDAGFVAEARARDLVFAIEGFETNTLISVVNALTGASTGIRFRSFPGVGALSVQEGAGLLLPTEGDRLLVIGSTGTTQASRQLIIELPEPTRALSIDLRNVIVPVIDGFGSITVTAITESGAVASLPSNSFAPPAQAGSVRTLGCISDDPIVSLTFTQNELFGFSELLGVDRVRTAVALPAVELGAIASPEYPLYADTNGATGGAAIALWGADGALIDSANGGGLGNNAAIRASLPAEGKYYLAIAPSGTTFGPDFGATGLGGPVEFRGTIAGRDVPTTSTSGTGIALYELTALMETSVLLPAGPTAAPVVGPGLASGSGALISADPGTALAVFRKESGDLLGAGSDTVSFQTLDDGAYLLGVSIPTPGPGGLASDGWRMLPTEAPGLASVAFSGSAPIPLDLTLGEIVYIPFTVGPGETVADLTTTGATLQGQAGFGESDGVVDLDDLGFFLNFWLLGTP